MGAAPLSGCTGTVWSQTFVHLPFGDLVDGYRLVYVDLDGVTGADRRVLCRLSPHIPSPAIGSPVTLIEDDGRLSLEATA